MNEIDLSLLPAPHVVEQLTQDELVKSRLDYLKTAGVDIDNFTPSDPLYRNVLSNSYRELLTRDYANNQAIGLTLAYARGADLDHIGLTYHRVARLSGELDDDYRRRIQLSPEGLSVAGPTGKYVFEALSTDLSVKDASFDSPAPVEVTITILSHDGNGTPSAAMVEKVNARLMDDGVRPQTDLVTVVPPTIVEYSLSATLKVSTGPDAQSVYDNALVKVQQYVSDQHRLGGSVTLFGVLGALNVPGVNDVVLAGFNTIICTLQQSPYCTEISLTTEVSA
jgi:phage-related baseplate assembly protein